MDPGSVVDLDIEKPAAGGRMLARLDGQVVLVTGAIPGERVRARIGRTGKGVVYAETVEVVAPSPDRRTVSGDPGCAGHVFAHIAYARQLTLKAEIVQDALGRIGRLRVAAPDVHGSPERGYRSRARLHVQEGRVGFYRDGTHVLCDAGRTGQLLPETVEWLEAIGTRISGEHGLTALELAESIDGRQRVCHLECRDGANLTNLQNLVIGGVTGISASTGSAPRPVQLSGTSVVTDTIGLRGSPGTPAVTLRHGVRAFFQGNRFLVEPLVQHVVSLVPRGPVLDLYSGVGLFGLSCAVVSGDSVTLVEGDRVAGEDLTANAEPYGSAVRVVRQSVEAFVSSTAVPPHTTCILDPPRTGLSRNVLTDLVHQRPARVVYVSCDVATLARDAGRLTESGYRLEGLAGFDLFPNTAHVEVVAAFARLTGANS